MIVAKTPSVQIEGKPARGDVPYENGITTYPTKRLSGANAFDLIDILNIGAHYSNTDLRTVDVSRLDDGTYLVTNLGELLFQSLRHARAEVLALCAKLIDVPVTAFDDGDYMPFDAPFLILASIPKQHDAQKLFALMGNVMRAMAPTASSQPSPAPSTE